MTHPGIDVPAEGSGRTNAQRAIVAWMLADELLTFSLAVQ
jgi:hypothetical protein